jgi:putative SOS response-associated peptidase YedK
MCNLYSITAAREAMLRLFRVGHNRAAALQPLAAVFPGHTAPVVRPAADGEREMVAMSWGFVLPQPGKAPRRVTNARDDKIAGRFWNDSFRARRCLVPATAFCEPTETTPADWVWFALAGDEARPLFAFAGLWRRHRGPVRKDGPDVEIDVFAFLTTEPNALTVSINHERSPVLLSGAQAFDTWLGGSDEAAWSLVRPFPAEQMRIVQRSRDKKDNGPFA